MNETSSLEEAGAVSYGLQGVLLECRSDSIQMIADAIGSIMSRVDLEAGGFFGHAKAIISSSSESISVNGVDPSLGVKVTGIITLGGKCEVKVMVAALDIPMPTLRMIMEEEMTLVEGFIRDVSRSKRILEVK
jgi:hypothetical protein